MIENDNQETQIKLGNQIMIKRNVACVKWSSMLASAGASDAALPTGQAKVVRQHFAKSPRAPVDPVAVVQSLSVKTAVASPKIGRKVYPRGVERCATGVSPSDTIGTRGCMLRAAASASYTASMEGCSFNNFQSRHIWAKGGRSPNIFQWVRILSLLNSSKAELFRLRLVFSAPLSWWFCSARFLNSIHTRFLSPRRPTPIRKNEKLRCRYRVDQRREKVSYRLL